MTGVSLAPIGILLLVACLIAMLSRRLGLPYIVGLVVAGFLIALLPNAPNLPLSRELIFNILLPPLVFEAALQLEWRRFRDELPLTLAARFRRRRNRRARWSPRHALAGRLELDRRGAVRRADRRDRPGLGHRRLPRDALRAARLDGGRIRKPAQRRRRRGRLRRAVGDRRRRVAERRQRHPAFLWTLGGGRGWSGLLVSAAILLIVGRTDDPLVEITLTTIAAYGSFLIAEHFHASGIISALDRRPDDRQRRLGRR